MADRREFKNLAVAAASSGDNTLIAANTTRGIKVWQMAVTSAGAVNVIFSAGATALSGTFVFGGNGSITLDYTGAAWFSCPPNTALIVNLSGAVALGGVLQYTLE